MTASTTSAAAGEPSPEDVGSSITGEFSSISDSQPSDDPLSSASPAGAQGGSGPEAGSATVNGEPRRKRRRRGGVRRRKRPVSDGPAGLLEHGSDDDGPDRVPTDKSAAREHGAPSRDEAVANGAGVVRKRRRRRRGGREGGEAGPVSRDSGQEQPDAEQEEVERAASEGGSEPKRPRRRRRGGAKRSKAQHSESAGPVAVEFIPGESDEFSPEESEELPELPDDAERVDGGRRSKRGRTAKRGRGREREPERARDSERSRDVEREEPAARRAKQNIILVNAVDREETRVAVVEDGHITEFQMTVRRHKSLVNDIYRGRVVNLEPAIGAAFIDFGQGRNGFLHTSDVLTAYGESDWKLEKLLTTKIDPDEWDAESSQPEVGVELGEGGKPEGAEHDHDHDGEHDHEHDSDGDHDHDHDQDDDSQESEGVEARQGVESAPEKPKPGGRRDRGQQRPRARPRLPISDLLKKGDQVVVQVTKDAIGDKGPTLTTYISIPGRYLVLMPSMARTGVSRKIEDEKERRRLKRLLEGLDVPPGMGVIVRTAGIGCTKAELKRDLDYLMLLWEGFGKRLVLGRGPVALYEESDVAIRTIRDMFTDGTEAVIVDDEDVFKRSGEFVERLMPENLDRIRLHDGSRPLFHTHGVEQDFERIFSRRLDLPCGGSIVMDQTEALVAIDVNSGKTRSEGFDFEEIALKTNLDAVPEIALQIRLRDLGGIIVIDFIDMLKSSHRRQVERALSEALSGDRARSKVGRISQFGLIELTRQRLGPGLSKMLFQNCPRCRGSGRLRTVESRCEAILRRLGAALTLKGFTRVEVRAASEVIDHLKANFSGTMRDMEARSQRELVLIPAPDQLEDNVLRYLRADGREVRPGGRRKR